MSSTQYRKVSCVVETLDGKVVKVIWFDPKSPASISVWLDGKQLVLVEVPKEETK